VSAVFPLSLRVAERRCVIVGGGAIAAQKAASLVVCVAQVTVISPTLHRDFAPLRVEHLARAYEIGDLAEALLVVAATDDEATNRAVFAEARARGVLCNVVDVPELCDFFYPAVVRRGDLTLTVSTNGIAPALAKALREQLQSDFDEGWSALLQLLAEVRDEIKAGHSTLAERQQAWDRIVNQRDSLRALLGDGRRDEARARVRNLAFFGPPRKPLEHPNS